MMRIHARYWLFGAVPLISTTAWAGLGDPLPGVSSTQQARFAEGREAFSEVEVVADGLGPVFNEASCAACHTTDSNAIGGNTTRVETRFGRVTNNNVFDPLPNFGGSLMQDRGIGRGDASMPLRPGCNIGGETLQGPANFSAARRTTPLFGLGLVEAVPDATFNQLAAQQQINTPTIAGTVHMVVDADTGQTLVGRFGWKSQVARLHTFAGDAYLNEMGITNPSFPDENCPQGKCNVLDKCNPLPALNDDGDDVDAFADFMQLLAPAPRATPPASPLGEQLFASTGCAACHVPTLTTGPSPITALANKTFHPYSDFLLHDMGTLGDGITQGDATGRLMRTAPLWGVRFQQTLLHDGRATTVRAAILAHEGQGAAARNAFQALDATQQQALLSFIATL